jgi:hypothetical protein
MRAELRSEMAAAARDLTLLAAGVVVLGLGAVLLLCAGALWVGEQIGSTAGGFALVGAGTALVGGAGLGVGAHRLGHQRIIPETVDELRRDVAWIKNGT